MSREQPTVADIFRRGQALRRENAQASYKEIKARLLEEYRGAPLPTPDKLAIPEQDARAPEEDWTAGLPLVLRGIQQQDWKEVINGIVLSLEQTENYERTRGGDSTHDQWHDRSVGIKGITEKSLGKWMPADLVALAERKAKEQ